MQQISASELAEWLAAARRDERSAPQLLDVREPWEFDICRIDDSVLIPMATVPLRIGERDASLDPDAETVVVCHHGVRSFQVAFFLERNGFSSVHNLTGGLAAWAHAVDPAMPTY